MDVSFSRNIFTIMEHFHRIFLNQEIIKKESQLKLIRFKEHGSDYIELRPTYKDDYYEL